MIEFSINIPEWLLAVLAGIALLHVMVQLQEASIKYLYYKLDKEDQEGKGGKGK